MNVSINHKYNLEICNFKRVKISQIMEKISELENTALTIEQTSLPIDALYEAHRHPVVKVRNCGNKFYIPKSKDDENLEVEKHLRHLKSVLNFPRVEKRTCRGIGMFLQNERLVKFIKDRFQKFGYSNKSGRYLNLDEALFLLETNRLEILWNDVSMSVQQAYNLFLDDEKLTLHKYLAFKKLALQGYPLKTKEKLGKEEDVLEECSQAKKIKLDRDNEAKTDIIKEDLPVDNKSEINNKKIMKLFEKLRQKVARKWDKQLEKEPDYYTTCKNKKINVYMEGQEMDPKIGTYESKDPNIFALKIDSTPLYHISKIILPDLI